MNVKLVLYVGTRNMTLYGLKIREVWGMSTGDWAIGQLQSTKIWNLVRENI